MCQMHGVQDLHSSRSLGFWVPSQLWVSTTRVEFMASLCFSLSYLFGYGFSLIHPRCRSYSVSFGGFYFKEIVFYVAVDLVYLWEKVSSGSSYITILNWSIYLAALICSFYCFLREMLTLLIIDYYFCLVYLFSAIHFLLGTSFTASDNLWYVLSSFHLQMVPNLKFFSFTVVQK